MSARTFFLISIVLAGYLLWMRWLDFNRPQLDPNAATSASEISAEPAPPANRNSETPTLEVAGETPTLSAPAAADAAASQGQLIEVRTDVYAATIDTLGGDLVSLSLLDYPLSPKNREVTVELLKRGASEVFVIQSGLSSSPPAAPSHQTLWTADADRYVLDRASDELLVPLIWTDAAGRVVTKTYRFGRGSYEIKLRHEVKLPAGVEPWQVQEYRQLRRSPPVVKTSFTQPESYSYNGAAMWSPEGYFDKLPFADLATTPIKQQVTGGWIAIVQHYFVAALIPPAERVERFETGLYESSMLTQHYLRQFSPLATVQPGASVSFESRIYAGPKLQAVLPDIAPGLSHVVDYGIFSILADLLFWLMAQIYKVVGNWGVAIIGITVFVKLLFYKLSEAQYRSMAKLRKLQPKLEALKERYGEDKQKLGQAMMDLYKKEGANPLGGCLPILVQIPVFIALYWVLLESVEMRHAPFAGWITDLSSRDPYFVLPILNAVVMYVTQKMTPMSGLDPLQQKVFTYMPLFFAAMFALFPAGLVLYWTVNGALSLLQMVIIMRQIEVADLKAKRA